MNYYTSIFILYLGMDLLYWMDLIGVFVFAISGALVAMRYKFDPFGILVLAFVTALGGGSLRDVIIDSHPLAWVNDINYIFCVSLAVVVSIVFRRTIDKVGKTMFIFDTIGIAVFTLLGLEKAISMGISEPIAITLGVTSAVFGGVIRDVLANREPLLFRSEVYATTCLIGATIYALMYNLDVSRDINFITSALVIVASRTIVVKRNIQLPKVY
jgi:uncharacterized membrane protein YeiH